MTTGNADQAQKLRSDLAALIERTRADQGLTAKAKRQRIARATLAARREMASLETNAKESHAAELSKARRTAFGIDDLIPTGGDAAALRANHRAALSQADAIEDMPTARALLERATDLGDEPLARAVAQRAHTMRWGPVVQQFAASRPQAAEAIERLGAGRSLPSAGELFRYVLPMPDELVSSVNRSTPNDHQLELLAAGEDVSGFGS